MSVQRTPRAAALHCIAKLYGVVEDMHAIALQQASAAVQQTERAIHIERTALSIATATGRTALTIGDREDALLAQSQGEIFAARAGMLEAVKSQRIALESTARAEFLASRLKTGQIKQLVTRIAEQTALEESRRTQAASDDRYAARRAWLSTRPGPANKS